MKNYTLKNYPDITGNKQDLLKVNPFKRYKK